MYGSFELKNSLTLHIYSDTMQIFVEQFAGNVGANQSKTLIHWTRHFIGSRQRLLKIVAHEVMSCTEASEDPMELLMQQFTATVCGNQSKTPLRI